MQLCMTMQVSARAYRRYPGYSHGRYLGILLGLEGEEKSDKFQIKCERVVGMPSAFVGTRNE